jgi:hypothetical protein
MPTANQILMHIAAVALVTAYLFGGSTPWVSKSTAVTVAIIESVNALVAWATRPFEQSLEAQRRKKACPDEEPPVSHAATGPLLTLAALRGPGRAACQFAAGGCVILVLARGLKLSGALTEPQHAVLPALALAFGARLLLKALLCSQASGQESTGQPEPVHVDDEFERMRATARACFDPAGDPYSPSFWEDLAEQKSAEGPPTSSEQISADVYLTCVFRT